MALEVYAWGRGEDGQLGLGDTNDQYKPMVVEALKDKNVVQVACGSGHTVVLSEDGDVYTWGRGDDGRLGHGDNGWKYVPRLVDVVRSKNIRQVTCGSYHTAAITDNGELYTWGGGMYGKLGHGNENGYSTPCLVEDLRDKRLIQIACGSRHTVVLLDTLDVYTWGDKENGVSGHGDTDGHQYTPRVVDALKDKRICQISACGFHSSALAENGDVYTWGEGKFGRLGNGSEHNQLTPRLIEDLHGNCIRQVSCGGFHSAAINETGELYTWGGGEHGQLGHGDKVNKTSPCLVEGLRDKLLVQITCGWSHTVALTDMGDVYTWGNGDHGKLGHGDTMKVTVPRLVEALLGKHVCRVASYNEHTASLTDPGRIPKTSGLTSTFIGDLRKLIDNSDFSDVVFIVEDKPVHAHRAFLAVRCDHFRAMFSSGMIESKAAEIVIPNIRFPIFMALFEYIYTDVIADITPEVAIELFIAADLYTLDRLKTLCEVVVQRGLNVDNAPTLLQAADGLHAGRMRELCIRFVVRHFDAVTKTSGFQMLSRDLILEVLQNR